MADTGIFCTTAEVLRKAGANASTVASDEAYTNDYVAQAESRINTIVRYNFSDNYATLNDDVKMVLKETASNIAAIYVLIYKPTGQDGLMATYDFENRIAILRDAVLYNLSVLRDKKVETFMKNA